MMAKVARRLAVLVAALAGVLCVGMAAGAAGLSVPTDTSVPAAGPGAVPLSLIGHVAYAAGFRGEGLAMAISVALAESGGNPNAVDYDSNSTVDRGLWQINSVHTQYSAACDYDPACAAGAAYQLSDGGRDWTAWVTFNRGAEIPYLPAAVAWVGSGAGGS